MIARVSRQLATAFALGMLSATAASAQNPIELSPDVTAELGSVSPAVVAQQNVAFDDAAGGVTILPPAGLPANVEVSGYELAVPGVDILLSLDTTVGLPGLAPGSPAEPRDVVRYDLATTLYSLAFDGSLNGIPANARIDAVGLDAGGDLLLSFDVSVLLASVGAVDDEDLVSFSGGSFTMVYDGSVNGIAPGLDLDGVSLRLATGELALSFDGTGSAGGVAFDDEDVIAFDPGLGSYAMYFDASLSDPFDWPAADLVAVPEPGGLLLLACGAGFLALLDRLRRA